ncbi:hypothetical protein WR25_17362 isoform B [Diploscapter pachys]|nr:hypothetical protein WR25_17362 isoform B [Diploscapter pachys]
MTESWNSSISDFLDTIISTQVMQNAWQFLQQNSLSPTDKDAFKSQLYTLWFQLYARNTAIGSSGFESVFSGETNSTNDVVRFNNWIKFYTQEQSTNVNYHGWFTKANGIQITLQFAWNDYHAMKQSFLLNSSPEFEFSAYTICALSGGDCTMSINGQSIEIAASTLSKNGQTVIDECYALSGGGPAPATTKKPNKNDPELQTLVDQMWAADKDRPQTGDIKINWGNKVNGKTDVSPDPMFTHVNEDLYKKPVYADLITTYNQNLFTPQVCTAESPMSGFKKSYLQTVFNTFTSSPAFDLAFKYLQNKKYPNTSSLDAFKPFLWNLWFGTYSRCSGTMGSSGWEHVFSGEWKGDEIDGQHDWTRYYLLEKAGKINYYGYYSYDSQLIGTFQYTWEKYLKPKGGFFTATSPAFDFSILTVCALEHSGANACQFNLDNYPIYITSYTQKCDAGTCISTAYPSDEP